MQNPVSSLANIPLIEWSLQTQALALADFAPPNHRLRVEIYILQRCSVIISTLLTFRTLGKKTHFKTLFVLAARTIGATENQD